MKNCVCALILFALNPCFAGLTAPTVKTVYSFTGKGKDVPVRHARLVQGKDGNFYGATNVRGAGNFGTIFKITPAGVRTTLHAFTRNGADGAEPCDGLAEDRHGNFYGTTIYGGSIGSQGQGTVFRITPAGRFSVLHRFDGSGFAGGSTDGALPHAGLTLGKDGNLYGTTLDGGKSHLGTVFRISPAGVVTIMHSFSDRDEGGILPYAGLVQGSDRNFYGTTMDGGSSGAGAVFRITLAGVFTVLHRFTGADGDDPSGLVQGSDGNIYGTTLTGGRWGNGAIFRISRKD